MVSLAESRKFALAVGGRQKVGSYFCVVVVTLNFFCFQNLHDAPRSEYERT